MAMSKAIPEPGERGVRPEPAESPDFEATDLDAAEAGAPVVLPPAPKDETFPADDVAERFIPVSRFELLKRMCRPELWGPGETETVARFFRYLAAWRHIVYNERLDKLEECYLPFSPETDLLLVDTPSPEKRRVAIARFLELIKGLLQQANYTEIPDPQLRQMLTRESEYGLDLHVNLDEFEHLLIFRRGSTFLSKLKRTHHTLYLTKRAYNVPIYQRLFILLKLKPDDVRLKEIMAKSGVTEAKARRLLKRSRKVLPPNVSTECVYIKMFKDIPRADIEMMFPNTRVKFRALDKLKLGITAGGGTAAAAIGTATKLMAALSPSTLIFAVLGLGGVISRQVMNFWNQRNDYMRVLAQNLYFHSLADNRGVITLLANRAEEEDIKEEILLYSVLAKEPVRESELGDVRIAIEHYLMNEFGANVRFDVHDAIARLMNDGVVIKDERGVLRALSPAEGCAHLDRLWDGYLNPDGADRRLIDEPRGAN